MSASALIDAIAQALWYEIRSDDPKWCTVTWDALSQQLRDRYRRLAEAVTEATYGWTPADELCERCGRFETCMCGEPRHDI